jgi:DNA polymerase kappa
MTKLEREIPGLKLRLMGLRCTNLVSTKKGGIDFFGTGHLSNVEARTKPPGTSKATPEECEPEWEVWPEGEFEEAARLEREAEMNELEQLSQQDTDTQTALETPIRSKRRALDNLNAKTPPPPPPPPNPWSCPICSRAQPSNDKAFNDHIDYCLSRQTIREAVRATSPPLPPPSTSISPTPLPFSSQAEPKGRPRGRPKKRKLVEGVSEGKKQQLLFGR